MTVLINQFFLLISIRRSFKSIQNLNAKENGISPNFRSVIVHSFLHAINMYTSANGIRVSLCNSYVKLEENLH